MSVEAMAWAFQVPLKPCPKSVLVALANRADQDGYCWPGLEDLEFRTGWNRRSIQRAVKELEASGLLMVTPRFTSIGVQTSNLYRLSMATVSCGEGVSPSPPGRLCVTPRVTVCHPQGDCVSPKSSSEQSVEQSVEHTPLSPQRGEVACVVSTYTKDFEAFWELYPNKIGKKDAWRAWQKARDRPRIEDLLTVLDQAKRSDRWRRGFIPNPATWLNQGRWADELPASGAHKARTMVEFMARHGGVG